MTNQHEFRLILTQFCNYQCFFCHSEGATEEHMAFALTPDDYCYIAELAKRTWGWKTITLTGGEPLISPIYYRTCQLLAQCGIRITTVTNASLLAKPSQSLAYSSQVNVSLHTMDPQIYKQIICYRYPLESVLQTIRQIRTELPQIEIHLNATIMHGYNDRQSDLIALIEFAKSVRAVPKFIDLASEDASLIVSVEQIIQTLKTLGFEVVGSGLWQTKLYRKSDQQTVLVTRCGFASAHQQLELRNLLVYPDGKMSLGRVDDGSLDVLTDIKRRNTGSLIHRLENYFPPINQSSKRRAS